MSRCIRADAPAPVTRLLRRTGDCPGLCDALDDDLRAGHPDRHALEAASRGDDDRAFESLQFALPFARIRDYRYDPHALLLASAFDDRPEAALEVDASEPAERLHAAARQLGEAGLARRRRRRRRG
ncbi:hypothetical protein emb_1d0639 [Coriobacteriaceae bacterium EMTCatB1]|nr:hypothetical protein emb_1d0639 [Coriobacteriaceae bacterium EMTCatB1]